MIRVGLTGSIAMGKSTVAAMFKARGAPVYDADDAIRLAYEADGAALPAIRALAPEAVTEQGVDRAVLKAKIKQDQSFLKRLEAAVHPVIAEQRRNFEAQAERDGAVLAVFDIPLLFETGLDGTVDVTVVVSAPEAMQRRRALARDGMTEDMLASILARQTPDAEKRRRADFIIDTGGSIEQTEAQVDALWTKLVSMAEERNAPG